MGRKKKKKKKKGLDTAPQRSETRDLSWGGGDRLEMGEGIGEGNEPPVCRVPEREVPR